jgi:membrane dipeptidase
MRRHAKERDSLKAMKKPNYEIEDILSRRYPDEAEAIRPPFSILLDHLDHIVRVAGIDHAGLGSDFDGIDSSPRGMDDVAAFPNITKALLERGYSKKDIKKILGENFLRVFKANQNQE